MSKYLVDPCSWSSNTFDFGFDADSIFIVHIYWGKSVGQHFTVPIVLITIQDV